MTPRSTFSDEDAEERSGPIRHLTPRELGMRWRISVRSLERWRAAGTGPAWIRLCGRVVYRLRDVQAYEAAHRKAPED